MLNKFFNRQEQGSIAIHQKYKKQQGLTLLEMMIVLVMIGLLTTLAVPSYQRYTQRAKFIEVIQALSLYKTSIMLCAYQQGNLEACSIPGQNGIPDDFHNPDRHMGYVDTIVIGEEGVITATSKNIQLDKRTAFTYTLKPILQPNGTLQWRVDDSTPDSCKHYHLC